jgi:Uncharacterized protein conserved in bacteria
LALLPVVAAFAADVTVTQPWARSTPAPGGAGAAFMTISNAGATADKLVKATSPVAGAAELHTHLMDGGVMRMRAVPAIEIPAGGSASLAPGGLHVMLINLNAPLTEGTSFPLSLTFEKAGEVTVTVPVMGPGSMGPGAAMPGGHPMPGHMSPVPKGH